MHKLLASIKDSQHIKTSIIIIISIIIGILCLGLAINFFYFEGGFSGIKTRTIWAKIGPFLNEYTNDDYKIIRQEGAKSIIQFDDGKEMYFECKELNLFNGGIGYGNGTYCYFSFKDSNIRNIGKYYVAKNVSNLNALVENTTGIEKSIVDEKDGYYRVSFSNDSDLQTFFNKLRKNEDFKNTWEMYKVIVSIFGKTNDSSRINDDNPINIINPDTIYIERWGNSGYDSLYDYAYRRNW